MGNLDMAAAGHLVTAQKKKPPSIAATLIDITRRMSLVALTLAIVMSVIYFPYSTDSPLTAAEQSDLQKYYDTAYQKEEASAEEKGDSEYVRMAKQSAEKADGLGNIRTFAKDFNLLEYIVLNLGSVR